MSSNETLTAPAPIPDAVDTQAASMPMAEELSYTYQRADGTVERARNAEDAIARCPVLGKLAIEAPDQASILLELAAAGNAKMAAEAKEEQKKPTLQEQHSEPKPTKAVESEKKVPETTPEQDTRAELTVMVSEPVEIKQPVIKVDSAVTERIERQSQETLRAFENVVEPVTVVEVVSEKPKVEALKENSAPLVLPVTDKVEPAKPLELNRNESVGLAPFIDFEVEQRRQRNTETQEIENEHTPTETAEYTTAPVDVGTVVVEDSAPITYSEEAIVVEPDEPTLIPEELVDTLDVEDETTDIETPLRTDNLETPEFTLDVDSDSSTELVNHELEAETDESIELLFEPETVETYLELRDLIAEQMDSENVLSETIELEASALNETETESELAPVESPTFEAFVTAQSVKEEVILESIKEQSNEQSLEQTLVQLVEYIADSAEDDEQLEPLLAIIKDIEKSLPKHYFEQKSGETKLQITPKMTDKLLALLRELGYQNPREALVSMVNKFGYTFLLQSLIYLFQLTDEDNRRELLSISTPAPISDDSPLSTLSKLILKLVMGKELLPDNIAA